ncbi:hypothetical protein GPJ61_00110 [Brevibacillus formosus]|uniref:hypothetical protein n=1 Tax=Brevibacillus formosus TaxID=54913 RepID=UPI001CA4937D|nr:hypothetical protein [Brevibacillus formosus]MBW5466276.1 hypothetical protein [Brevibacillus formosus]
MRVFTTNKTTVIDNDTTVVDLAAGFDLATISVSNERLHSDNLSVMYDKALKTKKPEDAARYVKMKQRYLDHCRNRDELGNRYE